MAEEEPNIGPKDISRHGPDRSGLTSGLRRHIPELAIECARNTPDRLWKTVDGTLCFADISGFTALAERLTQRGRVGGEELIETLSRVFGGMLDCARSYDGTLLKFGGDALLFLFRGDQHALRAACTALEMRRVLKQAAEIPTSVGRLRLSMSVGLHSGQLHFFLVGSGHRELILAGPEASRVTEIEGAAQAGQIAVSPETAAALPSGATRSRDDGILLLRWRKSPLSAPGPAPECDATPKLLRGLFPRALGKVLERGPPEPEHRVACIAFVRFSGTDKRLQDEGPDAVAAALQTTIGTAGEIFDAEGITQLAIDIDSDGGKLFLSTGVPVASEDDEGRMLRALRRLADANTPLPLQFGVNRGHVFAAEVGTRWRAAYSAMGDTTNTAARICAKAPPGMIFSHPSVLIQSRTKFVTEPVGPFLFKGKQTPQALYRVLDEAGIQATETSSAAPATVRQHELQALAAATEELSAGTGGVVSIIGATGLGKSRLLKQALTGLDDVPVLRLRAEPFRMTSPYGLLRDPIRTLLDIDAREPTQLKLQLEAAVARLDNELLPMLALLGDIAQIGVEPSAEVAALEASFRPDRTADAAIRIIAAAQTGPLVFAIEDADWADDASAHLLQRLTQVCAEHGWLMLVTRRDESGGFLPDAGPRLVLEPLPAEAIEALVIAATAAAPLRPHEVAIVVRRAGGNPLFAEEIIRTAREAGSFDAVPESLEAAIATQADALDPAARQVLRYATVLGNSFPREVLDTLLESEGRELDQDILPRLHGFLLKADNRQLRFRNDLVRTTIYESLAYRLRGRLHRVAGETLERLATDARSEANILARHFYLAGNMERTWHYSLIAANRARRAYANPEAASLYEMAIDAARRLPDVDDSEKAETWRKLGEVREWAGIFDQALAAFRQATKLVRNDPVVHARLLVYRAHARERSGAFSAALRELSIARRLIQDLDTPFARETRAKIESFTAMLRFAQERYREALELAQAALPEARAAGNPAALAETLVTSGSAQQALGEGDASHMLEALEIYEEIGDLSSEANVRGNLGCSEFLAGNWDKALEWFDTHQDTCLRAGNVAGAATAASNIGEIMVKRRQFDAAEPILRDAARVMRASGFHDGAAYAEIQIARILVERAQFDRADEMMAGVAGEFARIGQPLSALEAVMVQALAKCRGGGAAEALDLLDRAAEATGEDARLFEPQIAEIRARLFAALGKFDQAKRVLRGGLTSARNYGLPYEEAMLLLARIEIATLEGFEPEPTDTNAYRQLTNGLGIDSMPRP